MPFRFGVFPFITFRGGHNDDEGNGHGAISEGDELAEGWEWGPMGVLLKKNDGKTCCCAGGFRGDCVVHGFKGK